MFYYRGKSPNFHNKLLTRSTNLGTINTNDKDIYVFVRASLIDLDKCPFSFIFLTYSIHPPASLNKGGSICD